MCIHIYIYIYICMHIHAWIFIHIYVYIYIDCLANILAWSKSDPTASLNNKISIDTIELPRLRLTFEKKICAESGKVQYMCLEQSGTYLTGYDESLRFDDLLEGLPRAVLITNSDHEYFVLLPAIAKPVLTKMSGSGLQMNMVSTMSDDSLHIFSTIEFIPKFLI
jgi:hypothetical protein